VAPLADIRAHVFAKSALLQAPLVRHTQPAGRRRESVSSPTLIGVCAALLPPFGLILFSHRPLCTPLVFFPFPIPFPVLFSQTCTIAHTLPVSLGLYCTPRLRFWRIRGGTSCSPQTYPTNVITTAGEPVICPWFHEGRSGLCPPL